jgi:Flp pilus assembly pilin Flp
VDTLLISRKFYALILGIVTIVKIPPFDTIGAKWQAIICGAIICSYILGTGISGGLERLGSIVGGKAVAKKTVSATTTTTSAP